MNFEKHQEIHKEKCGVCDDDVMLTTTIEELLLDATLENGACDSILSAHHMGKGTINRQNQSKRKMECCLLESVPHSSEVLGSNLESGHPV